jgi:hypothetical protein
MSYPSYIHPRSVDVDAVAAQLVARQSDPNIPGGPALSGVALDYAKAIADAIMTGVGYQVQHDVAGNGAGGATSITFVDAAYASLAYTAPIAKTYLINVDASVFASAGTADTIELRLMVDGIAKPTTGPVYLYLPSTNVIVNASWRVPVALTAAAHTLKLQWRTFSGNVTVNSNANTRLQITVTG